MSLKISLAGRVSMSADGVLIDEDRFPGRQGRLVFAYLVNEQGRPVPRDELAEALWGETPPATWEKALTVIVSKLRGLLEECGVDGGKALTSAFGCYRLDLPKGSWVDLDAAVRAVGDAERALSASDFESAEAEATKAAPLARRRFLPGEDSAWVDEKRRELAEILHRALLCLADVALRSGDASQGARCAEEAVALEPFRETGYRRLMQAHAAAGNRAEALRVYDRCRRLLSEELGAYPSPETESLYRDLLKTAPAEIRSVSVLEQEDGPVTPSLELPSTAGPERQRRRPSLRRRRGLGLAGVVLLAGALAVLAVELTSADSVPIAVVPNSVAVIDPGSNRVVADVRVGRRPRGVAVGGGSVWVANADDGTVSRIDPANGRVVQTIGVGGEAYDVAVSRDAVWVVTGSERSLVKIDLEYGIVQARLNLPGAPEVGSFAVAAGYGAIWAASGRQILKIHADQPSIEARIAVPETPLDVAIGAGAVWEADEARVVTRISPTAGSVNGRVTVENDFPSIAAGFGSIWVASSVPHTQFDYPGHVTQIEPPTLAVLDVIRVGKGTAGIAVGAGSVWTANGFDGTVSRIDPSTGEVARTIHVGGRPSGIAVGADRVWVTIG